MNLIALAAVGAALAGAVTGDREAATQTAPPAASASTDSSQAQFYGFVRQDIILDGTPPDSAQSPLFILAQPAGAPSRHVYTMHPRLTRLGVNMTGPALEPLGGARIAATLEVDFQNGGRDSRAIPRYRHAYMTLTWSSGSLLLGQTWDLISPLFPSVNADTLMWNAGNLGDRRPQVRATLQRPFAGGHWSLAGAAGLTGAVDQQDLDADGLRDGEAAATPTLQTRAGVAYPAGGRQLTLGVWAHRSEQAVSIPVAGAASFGSHALGMDLELPLGRRAWMRGEAWTGSNLADVRGGIGQGINRTTGDGIDSSGGWIEAGGEVTARYSLFGGYTIDSPHAADVPAGGRLANSAWFIVNRLSADRPFVFGVDYLRWRTRYRGHPDGTDNRLNTYVTYSF